MAPPPPVKPGIVFKCVCIIVWGEGSLPSSDSPKCPEPKHENMAKNLKKLKKSNLESVHSFCKSSIIQTFLLPVLCRTLWGSQRHTGTPLLSK